MKYSDELLAFLAVTQHKSFAEAARSMNLPTSTISRKIQQLESELGVKLLDRTTRSLSLTEVAKQLLPKVKLIVETLAEFKEEAELHKNNPTGTLHITAAATIIQRLAPLLSEFLQMHPNIRFNLDCSSRNRDITAQSADFALRLGPLNDSSLIAIPLSRIHYMLVSNQHLIEALPMVKHPADLACWPCIRNHIDGLLLPWHFIYESELFNLDPKNPILSDDLMVSRQLALHGAGVARLPKPIVKADIDKGRLVTLHEEWMPPARELYLVYSDKKHLPSKSTAFIEFMRDKRHTIKQIFFDCD